MEGTLRHHHWTWSSGRLTDSWMLLLTHSFQINQSWNASSSDHHSSHCLVSISKWTWKWQWELVGFLKFVFAGSPVKLWYFLFQNFALWSWKGEYILMGGIVTWLHESIDYLIRRVIFGSETWLEPEPSKRSCNHIFSFIHTWVSDYSIVTVHAHILDIRHGNIRSHNISALKFKISLFWLCYNLSYHDLVSRIFTGANLWRCILGTSLRSNGMWTLSPWCGQW